MSEGLLLDTCALIYLAHEPELLSEPQSLALRTMNRVTICCISCAEIACLVEKGRLELDRHWKVWFHHFTQSNGIQILDVDHESLIEAYSLPGPFHRDPCDRIIVGTARKHDLSIVTSDRKILDYPFADSIS
ncbi:MAG TPA: type II toxin-antitoxin system VapC family toxin [Opitutales bacterium]|nr:type II toxin-antitoxin system VapC family toxin [Opitutales bacterium]